VVELTVVIVNYNSGEYLISCLKSLEDVCSEAKIQTYVVDNASIDGSVEKAKAKFGKVKFIINGENVGFGKANNQVLKILETEFVLILNPDSKVTAGTIKYMLEFMERNPQVGASSCKLEKLDGSIDWASHRGFPTPWASFRYFFLKDDSLYHLTKKDFTREHEVDSIVGAFFLTRKSVLEKVGYFDEDYFMYAEDIDLCFRIKKAGYKIMYVPQVKAIHLKGVSSGIKKHSKEISLSSQDNRVRSLNYFYSTMKIFYRKNLARKYPLLINWLIYLGINLKWLLAKRKLEV
jgi:GT2 family glycosyltransferase